VLNELPRPSLTNRPEHGRSLATPGKAEINVGSYGEKLFWRLFLEKYRIFGKMEKNKSCS